MKFGKYEPEEDFVNPAGNHCYRFWFKNGYGASVINGPWSYGGSLGLWELAVLKGNRKKNKIVYDTPITNDVIGCLEDSEVAELLEQIEALPPKNHKKRKDDKNESN